MRDVLRSLHLVLVCCALCDSSPATLTNMRPETQLLALLVLCFLLLCLVSSLAC